MGRIVAASKYSYFWSVTIAFGASIKTWYIIADNFNQCCIITGLHAAKNDIKNYRITKLEQLQDVICLTTEEEEE